MKLGADDKVITMSDDIAITLIVIVGVFLIILLIGLFLLILLKELKKGTDDE